MAYIIGIGGGSGSGKTTLARALQEIYKNDISIINFDCYCLSADGLSMEERAKRNYDIPSSYDMDLFEKHLQLLKNGKEIDCPIFDYSTHSRTKEVTKVKPNKIIIVEGILVFQAKNALKDMNLKVYVDASTEVRFQRRMRRDIVERGRTKESVTNQFYSTVLPMHNIYIEPTKEICDFILNNEKDDGLDLKQVQEIVKIIDGNII
ncbi:MAG: uridine kinase [Bacilli bacterium]